MVLFCSLKEPPFQNLSVCSLVRIFCCSALIFFSSASRSWRCAAFERSFSLVASGPVTGLLTDTVSVCCVSCVGVSIAFSLDNSCFALLISATVA